MGGPFRGVPDGGKGAGLLYPSHWPRAGPWVEGYPWMRPQRAIAGEGCSCEPSAADIPGPGWVSARALTRSLRENTVASPRQTEDFA